MTKYVINNNYVTNSVIMKSCKYAWRLFTLWQLHEKVQPTKYIWPAERSNSNTSTEKHHCSNAVHVRLEICKKKKNKGQLTLTLRIKCINISLYNAQNSMSKFCSVNWQFCQFCQGIFDRIVIAYFLEYTSTVLDVLIWNSLHMSVRLEAFAGAW